MVILLSTVISQANNLTSVINSYKYFLKMMKKYHVRLYGYSILPLMIKKDQCYRCLDCNAEVSAKVKSALGRDETVFFFN